MRIRNLWLLATGAVLAGSSLVWGADVASTKPTDNKFLGGPKATRTEKAGPTLAARKEGAPGERGARLQKLRTILQELNLTDDQKRQIKEAFQEEKAQFQQWENDHKDIAALREDLRAAKEVGDKAKAQEIQQKLAALQATAPKFETFLDKVRAILTDEQKTQLEQKLKEAREGGPTTKPAEKPRVLREKRGA